MHSPIACDLPYGKNQLAVRVAGDRIVPRSADPVDDEAAVVRDALRNPIGTAPLRDIVHPGERVAIVVNDITRLTRTDLMLPPVIETLNAAGIPDRDIFIVFALGIHRRQTEDERRLIVGEEIYSRIRCFDHISTDDCEPGGDRHYELRQSGGDQSRRCGKPTASSLRARSFTI